MIGTYRIYAKTMEKQEKYKHLRNHLKNWLNLRIDEFWYLSDSHEKSKELYPFLAGGMLANSKEFIFVAGSTDGDNFFDVKIVKKLKILSNDPEEIDYVIGQFYKDLEEEYLK